MLAIWASRAASDIRSLCGLSSTVAEEAERNLSFGRIGGCRGREGRENRDGQEQGEARRPSHRRQSSSNAAEASRRPPQRWKFSTNGPQAFVPLTWGRPSIPFGVIVSFLAVTLTWP